jgi:hypothetical protein
VVTSHPTVFLAPTEDKGDAMRATQQLDDLGQSIWLDNISRDLLTSGTRVR